MNQQRKYCFDASAFIDSWRRYYRPNSFKQLWERIGELIKNGLILIPEEVKKEIGAGNDELIIWLKEFNSYIVAISNEQIEIVTEIVNKYPLASQYKKPKPYHADPFVVAVGKLTSSIVVTYEIRNRSSDNPKIPDLCKEYEVEYCSVSGLFEREEWQFALK